MTKKRYTAKVPVRKTVKATQAVKNKTRRC